MDIERVRLLRHGTNSSTVPHRTSRWKPGQCLSNRRVRLVLYAVSGAGVIGVVVALVPLKQLLESASAWIDLHPTAGVLLLPVLFVIAIPLAIPVTLLEIASGSVFGFVQGTMMNAAGMTCGSLVAFLVGKRLGKQRLGGYLQTRFPTFSALSRVVEGPNWKPLLLLQLSSLPPVVKSYGLSITDISLVRFAVTSFIGGFPGALLWASIGHQTKGALVRPSTDETDRERDHQGARWLVLLVGVACTVLAMGFLVVYTRRELRAELQHVKRSKKVRSTGEKAPAEQGDREDDDEDTASEEMLPMGTEDDLCEVVITQVATTDTEQQVAKRTSTA